MRLTLLNTGAHGAKSKTKNKKIKHMGPVSVILNFLSCKGCDLHQ